MHDTTTAAAVRALSAAAGHDFVDRIHALSTATGGAVHGFVGDTVVLSWNAASRSVQPDVKAARFLARLRADPGHRAVSAWGCAAYGSLRVQLAGSSGHQHALLVSPLTAIAGFAPDTAAAAIARKHKIFVCDRSVVGGASHAVVFRGVGVAGGAFATHSSLLQPSDSNVASPLKVEEATSLPVTWAAKPNNTATTAAVPTKAHIRGVPLYEVVGEQTEGTADEWLYVLDRQATVSATNPHAALCKAAEAAAAGDIREARRLVAEVIGASHQTQQHHPAARDAVVVDFSKALEKVAEFENSLLPATPIGPAGATDYGTAPQPSRVVINPNVIECAITERASRV